VTINDSDNVRLPGVYVECPERSLRFRWVTAPMSAEFTRLAQTLEGFEGLSSGARKPCRRWTKRRQLAPWPLEPS